MIELSATFYALLAVYVFLVIPVGYFIFVADPSESPTTRFLTGDLPNNCQKVLERCLNGRIYSTLHFLFADSVFYTLYWFIYGTLWTVIFSHVYPWQDRLDCVSSYHRYIGYAVCLSLALTWHLASSTSPGLITASDFRRFDHSPYDGLLFVKGRICKTRDIPRLPRSKFDRFKYKENVARYDHFCSWLDNAIGEENYRFFLLFLVVHLVACVYGIVMVGLLFQGEITADNLFEEVFVDQFSGAEMKGNRLKVYKVICNRHLLEIAVVFMLTAALIPLGMMLFTNVKNTSAGMTYNESEKWKKVAMWHREEMECCKDDKRNATVTSDVADVLADELKSCKDKVEALARAGIQPVNIYDNGFMENWMAVLFPLSLRKGRVLSV